jgi:NAD(P)-dependent dehydrogenase (short-subunit alcohol dehydrogenase family)
MSQFEGRVAAVTGAGSGIGRALALGLARRGADLALSDVNEVGLAETAREAEKLGVSVHQRKLDVADRDAVFTYADEVAAHFGKVNQIYNNAGIGFARPVLESEMADYDRMLSVNLWGVIHGTRAFLPHLVTSGDGHVINISSLNGYMAMAEMSHYCTSKFAVRGFTESLRMEMLMDRLPVRVTCVHPGGVSTAIAASSLEHARELGIPISPEDEQRLRRYERKMLRMPPERAADIILKGVARNRGRVRVGNDAVAIDLLVRALPSLYPRIVGAMTKRVLPRPERRAQPAPAPPPAGNGSAPNRGSVGATS